MDSEDAIVVKIISDGEEYLINTFRYEYRSLMALIRDSIYTDGFGECGGMGRCATCQVQVNHVKDIGGMDRNESSTLTRQGVMDPSVRLSCQLLIDAPLNGATVTILI